MGEWEVMDNLKVLIYSGYTSRGTPPVLNIKCVYRYWGVLIHMCKEGFIKLLVAA